MYRETSEYLAHNALFWHKIFKKNF